ncbi:aminoacyl-trna synthetase cofactor [Stylonychia lemnae]|uniref:Aminoacyl-trna synthetase cofactor n=1 Tax=Stylonychia lemnae TaxID=5949 RepID=A0A077ZQ01_STYLE|nr:aminoacyl-trna synthetase cofactor [Stylonychia lemnae]|eukprot:CDW72012.1 aminoacyl-trna synthetase cofactor [Stylonychia lemnae]
MELFISQNIQESKLSLTVQLFANYLRATSRKMVNLTPLTKITQQSLQLAHLPLLIKSTSDAQGQEQPVHTANPSSIMLEIARSVYLEEVLFGKPDSLTRLEILSFIELSIRLSPSDLATMINDHLSMKMFLVGHSITTADIVALAHLLHHFNELADHEKFALPHVFRWIDHVQHLPGLLEQVQQHNLFVSFPDESNSQPPSKSQLKKLAKAQASKEKKVGGESKAPAEKKAEVQSQTTNASQSTEATNNEEKKEAPKQEKKPKQQQQTKKQPAKKAAEEAIPEISQMDFRVGKIVKVWVNPNSEKLYNEEVDIGNGEIRSIASGLQKLVPIQDMTDAMCIVLCNLKPRNLAGHVSHGMVLCAETPDRNTAELLQPPAGAQPGDLVTFEGYERRPPDALNPKKNPWDVVAEKIKIDENGVALFESIPWTVTGKGVVTSKVIKNGVIH